MLLFSCVSCRAILDPPLPVFHSPWKDKWRLWLGCAEPIVWTEPGGGDGGWLNRSSGPNLAGMGAGRLSTRSSGPNLARTGVDGAIGVGGAPNRSRVIDCVFSAEGRSRGPVSECGQVSSEATRQRAVDIEDVPRDYMIRLSDTLTFKADPDSPAFSRRISMVSTFRPEDKAQSLSRDGPLGRMSVPVAKKRQGALAPRCRSQVDQSTQGVADEIF